MNENACAICHERFSRPEFARRCEAQGVPPLRRQVGDVLLWRPLIAAQRRWDELSQFMAARRLYVVTEPRVHHALGVTCPVDGPCEHTARQVAYPMIATKVRVCGREMPAFVSLFTPSTVRQFDADDAIGRLLFRFTQKWGVIYADGDAAGHLIAEDPARDWARLWRWHERLKREEALP